MLIVESYSFGKSFVYYAKCSIQKITMKTLGIDLGVNSLGWAIIDQEKPSKKGVISASGVRIFKEGVDNLGQGEREMSPNAARRMARQRRRQGFRRKLRKNRTLDLLHKHGMSPGSAQDLKDEPQKFTEWFKLNPYQLRHEGLTRVLSPLEFGRAIYHIAQRRGFQSNSRQALAAEASEKSKIMEGAADKPGITTLAAKLEETGQTLGSYLHGLYPAHGAPFEYKDERIRNRWTSRRMYIDEFERLWTVQSSFDSKRYTFELREKLGGRKRQKPSEESKEIYQHDGELFFQRPLKSQKSTIGKCSFERSKPRMPKSHPLFEEARAWQFINTILVDGEMLVEQHRQKAWLWLRSKDKAPKFAQLRRHLKLADAYLNFNYLDDHKLPACPTLAKFSGKKVFGNSWWDLSEKEQEDRWHVIQSADDVTWLTLYATSYWKLSEANAAFVGRRLALDDGYGNLSRMVIKQILPFLRDGLVYSEAVALGGVARSFGENWKDVSHVERGEIKSEVLKLVRKGDVKGYIEPLRIWLENHYSLSDKQLDKLYHHSVDQSQVTGQRKINTTLAQDIAIDGLRNPVVMVALYELRRVVNSLVDTYGHKEGAPFDLIKLEMGKSLKGNKSSRQNTVRQQKANRERNEAAAEWLEENTYDNTYSNRLKYKLWKECEHICPYSGDTISEINLFGENPDFEIEHIHPYSRTLNDSFSNVALCRTDINREKDNKTPYEFYSQKGTAEWEQAKARALSVFKNSREYPKRYNKFKRFVAEHLDDDFISRQLNDMRYAARESRKLLQQISTNREDVLVLPGRLTSDLRHLWGLNSLLNDSPEDTPDERAKNRADHRHHAVDAIVVACSTRGNFHRLSEWNKYADRRTDRFNVKLPWESFRLDVNKSLQSILVSYRQNNRVLTVGKVITEKPGLGGNKTYTNDMRSARGQLHKETIYGKRVLAAGSQGFHVRKSVADITDYKKLQKVVDAGVRAALGEVLWENQIDPSDPKAKYPKGTFTGMDANGKTTYKAVMPNRRGDEVPIKHVRIRENLSNAEQLKDDVNQYVNPRNNHHVLIYETHEGALAEDVVTLWTAADRKNSNQSLIQLPEDGADIVTVMMVDDLFLLDLPADEDVLNWEPHKLSDHLYRVQKLSSMYYTFRHHLASTLKYDDQQKSMQSFGAFVRANPIKVNILQNGKIARIV